MSELPAMLCAVTPEMLDLLAKGKHVFRQVIVNDQIVRIMLELDTTRRYVFKNGFWVVADGDVAATPTSQPVDDFGAMGRAILRELEEHTRLLRAIERDGR